ncbi:MAG: hypothetical protein U1E70_11950 [Acetobacteraceae bacterium]|nr:hypothetical protein [Pseudomonadota bacterium]
MRVLFRAAIGAALCGAAMTGAWAQESNPGNSAGGHNPVAYPMYPGQEHTNPALTTGSRYSVAADTPMVENPTVPGATGLTIIRGDNSTISGDRRATVIQKTSGSASDAPG